MDWYNFCREICIEACLNYKDLIGGEGKTVEIDESKFGTRKHYRGRRVDGQWVFGGVERDSKKCFLVPVANRDAVTLTAIIKEYVKPGTTIISERL